MNYSLILVDLIPVLIFVVLDSLGKVRYAILAALLAAGIVLAYHHFLLGGVDGFVLLYAALFLVFGGLSIKFNNAIFFKFKPVAVSIISSVFFLVTYLNGAPVMVTMVDRLAQYHAAGSVPAEVAQFLTPVGRELLTNISFYMIFGLLLHAGLVAWVALGYNTWWWLTARYAGFFFIAVLVIGLSM